MSQSTLLKRVTKELHSLQIPFMLTGSLVSSLQGEPRSTHDIDLVVELPVVKIDELASRFSSPEFYLSTSAMHEAIINRTMFNLLHLAEGDKVDFWMLTDEPFDQSRFARRQSVNIDGTLIDVSSPEDTILMKLKWAKESAGSDRQLRDALRVYEVQKGIIDHAYLADWVVRLEVSAFWEELLRNARPID